jgi:hypothetical protein
VLEEDCSSFPSGDMDASPPPNENPPLPIDDDELDTAEEVLNEKPPADGVVPTPNENPSGFWPSLVPPPGAAPNEKPPVLEGVEPPNVKPPAPIDDPEAISGAAGASSDAERPGFGDSHEAHFVASTVFRTMQVSHFQEPASF